MSLIDFDNCIKYDDFMKVTQSDNSLINQPGIKPHPTVVELGAANASDPASNSGTKVSQSAQTHDDKSLPDGAAATGDLKAAGKAAEAQPGTKAADASPRAKAQEAQPGAKAADAPPRAKASDTATSPKGGVIRNVNDLAVSVAPKDAVQILRSLNAAVNGESEALVNLISKYNIPVTKELLNTVNLFMKQLPGFGIEQATVLASGGVRDVDGNEQLLLDILNGNFDLTKSISEVANLINNSGNNIFKDSVAKAMLFLYIGDELEKRGLTVVDQESREVRVDLAALLQGQAKSSIDGAFAGNASADKTLNDRFPVSDASLGELRALSNTMRLTDGAAERQQNTSIQSQSAFGDVLQISGSSVPIYLQNYSSAKSYNAIQETFLNVLMTDRDGSPLSDLALKFVLQLRANHDIRGYIQGLQLDSHETGGKGAVEIKGSVGGPISAQAASISARADSTNAQTASISARADSTSTLTDWITARADLTSTLTDSISARADSIGARADSRLEALFYKLVEGLLDGGDAKSPLNSNDVSAGSKAASSANWENLSSKGLLSNDKLLERILNTSRLDFLWEDDTNSSRIKKQYENLFMKLELIRQTASAAGFNGRDQIIHRLENIENSARFINDLNNQHLYMQVSLASGNNTSGNAELFIMKRGGSRKRINPDDATLFISLNTDNIGKIESLIHLYKKSVSLNLRAKDNMILDTLKQDINSLHNALLRKGYKLSRVTYALSEKKLTVSNAIDEADKVFPLSRQSTLDLKV